jgi:hypothetical protein
MSQSDGRGIVKESQFNTKMENKEIIQGYAFIFAESI